MHREGRPGKKTLWARSQRCHSLRSGCLEVWSRRLQRGQREDLARTVRSGFGGLKRHPKEQGWQGQSQRCREASEQGRGIICIVTGSPTMFHTTRGQALPEQRQQTINRAVVTDGCALKEASGRRNTAERAVMWNTARAASTAPQSCHLLTRPRCSQGCGHMGKLTAYWGKVRKEATLFAFE